MKIYVGNLPYTMSGDELKKEFEEFGKVTDATIIRDRETERSRGFGFVEMENEQESLSAIESLNGKDIAGRKLVVNQAKPREDRGPRRSGGSGGRFGKNYNR